MDAPLVLLYYRGEILQQDGFLGVITDDAFGDGSAVLPFVQESRERAAHLGDHAPKEG